MSCSLASKGGLSVVALLLAVLIGAHYIIVDPKNIVFDQVVLQELVKTSIADTESRFGKNATASQLTNAIIKAVKKRYPNDISVTNEWLFNNAGGAMGSMTILHASFSEYLIIFGTALGTEGHTGRFFADDYFTIFYGEQWAYPANTQDKEIYRPGDQHHLPWGVAKQYRMPDGCWALEYARGNIPSMMLFGLGDGFSSTFDFVTLWQTIRGSAVNMLTNALRGKI
jgi:C-8 sterol isomerase